MSRSLRVLIVEDSENDALLVLDELRDGGYDPVFERVDTSPAMQAALERQEWDVIIADYKMPSFSGLDALELACGCDEDCPLIIVSGQISEETAVNAMRAGAKDYVVKGNLARLVPAVERELREAEVRRERRQAQEALDAERRRLRAVMDALPVGVFIADATGRIVAYNDQVKAIWGEGAVYSDSIEEYSAYKGWWADTGQPISAHDWAMARAISRGETSLGELIDIQRFDGKTATILNSAAPVRDAEGHVVGAVAAVQDVTEMTRLRAQLEQALTEARKESEHASALEGIAEAGIATTDLQELLNTLVSRMADVLNVSSCSIWMLDEDKREFVSKAACGHPGVVGKKLRADEGVAGIVYNEKRPVSISDVERERLVLEKALRERGIRSLLSVPLIARNRVVGMTRVGDIEVREFDEDELGLLEAMAARAAQAIENIKLYEDLAHSRNQLAEALAREKHFSLLLQRALLPGEPEIGSGYEVSAEYVPMFHSREIGGDFYDVFRVDDTRAGVLIGDVSGKGLEAAAMAAATRSTIHAFVHETPSPAEALRRANAVLYACQGEFGSFVTVFLLVIDFQSAEVRYANAGHPPAAICRSDGRVELMRCGQLPLTVLESQDFDECHVAFSVGDRIVLYTDGISEARHDSEMLDLEGVQNLMSEHAALPTSQLAHALVAAATDWAEGKLADDAAVLVVEKTA